MNIDELKSVANAIVAKQKGVLAADESNPTIAKRFDSIKVKSTEENRRRYREILFTAAGIERNVGGVILYDETLRQSTHEGIPFPTLLASRGIIPGIKVDNGAKALALWRMDIKAAVLKVPTPDFGERFHLPVSCPIQARRADEEQLIYLDEAVVLT